MEMKKVFYQFITPNMLGYFDSQEASELEKLTNESFSPRVLVPGFFDDFKEKDNFAYGVRVFAGKHPETGSYEGLLAYMLVTEEQLGEVEQAEAYAYIDKMVVHPNHTENGIGSELLNIAVDQAASKKMPLVLRTAVGEQGKHEFYLKKGQRLREKGISYNTFEKDSYHYHVFGHTPEFYQKFVKSLAVKPPTVIMPEKMTVL